MKVEMAELALSLLLVIFGDVIKFHCRKYTTTYSRTIYEQGLIWHTRKLDSTNKDSIETVIF